MVCRGGNRTVDEGTTVNFDGSGSSDTEADIFAYQWTLDGGSTTDGITASQHYAEDGLFPVSLSVTDTAGSIVADTIQVTVENVPAVIAPIDDGTANEGVEFSFSTTFADAGVQDSHTAHINWDDGTSSAGAIDEANGAGTVAGSHTFADDSTYTVTVTVTDDEGDSSNTQFAVTVANVAPAITAAPAEQTTQYSDPISPITVGVTDVVADTVSLVGTSYSVDGGAFMAGLPNGLSISGSRESESSRLKT